MKIFVSYASEQRAIAERIYLKLVGAGHDVFFDRQDLPPGHSFDERIRESIDACDLFVFLLTPSSIEPGSYALTELELARRKWPHPKGRVLAVHLGNLEDRAIPNYLRANIYLSPTGDAASETLFAVQRMVEQLKRPTEAEAMKSLFHGRLRGPWLAPAILSLVALFLVSAVYLASRGPDVSATQGVAAGGNISVGGSINVPGADRTPKPKE